MEKPFALIIEDEREIAALFRHVLDMAGFHTELIFHGQVAVERLAQSKPDLVLLDLRLPVVPGAEIIKLIRNDKRLNYTKIIVVSAHAYLVKSLVEKPDYTLLKPVGINQLTKLVAQVQLSKKSQKPIPIIENPWTIDTDIYNEPFFINRLETALRQSKEISQYRFAVLLVKINYKNSKKQTDLALQESILHEVSESLKSSIRKTDTVATFDHANIYVLLEHIPNEDTPISIASRIRERLLDHVDGLNNKIKFPTRIGILLCDGGYESTDEILRDAEHAQLMATAQGDEYYKYYYQVSVKKSS